MAPPHPSLPRRLAASRLAPLYAAAAVLLVFHRVGHASFAFDDTRFIVENPHVLRPDSWLRFLHDPRTTDPLSPTGIVRPLRTLEFALDHALFGLDPGAFHLHSLLWHAAGAALAVLLFRRLLGDPLAALAAAVVWAVHPMQVEAVAWISSRGDVAMGACTIAALVLHLDSRGRDLRLAASLLCGALAVLYKETAVVLPALVFAVRLVRPRAGPPGRVTTALRDAAPYVALSAVYLVYRALVQVGATTHVETHVLGGSAAGTFATMFRGLGAYFAMAAVPAVQALDWYMTPSRTLADPAALGWLAALLALVAAAVACRRRAPVPAAAVALFLFALVPVANWPFYIGIPTAERFLHLPLLGGALFAAWTLLRAARASRTAWLAAALAAGALGTLSWQRTAVWQSAHDLWYGTLAQGHASPRARQVLAADLKDAGYELTLRARELPPGPERSALESDAREHFERSLAHAHAAIALWYAIETVERSTSHVLVEPENNAAHACWFLGRHGESLFHAEEAVRIGGDLFPQPHYNRALALLALGRGPAAFRSMERAVAAGMDDPDPETVRLFARAGDLARAEGYHELALGAYDAALAVGAPGPAADAVRRAREGLARELDDRLFARLASRRQAPDDVRLAALHAIDLAAAGRVEDADRIRDELAGRGAFPQDLETDWARMRYEARATAAGWEAALALHLRPGTPGAERLFRAARCAEELGRDAEAARLFERALEEPAGGPLPEPDRDHARRAVDRIRTGCPVRSRQALPAIGSDE